MLMILETQLLVTKKVCRAAVSVLQKTLGRRNI
jgi:hypothetical protein